MHLVAALIYWIVVGIWLNVIAVVLHFYRHNPRIFGTTHLIRLVIAIDTTRNVVENTYFGAYFGGRYGLLPGELATLLGQPALLILPKLLNVAAGTWYFQSCCCTGCRRRPDRAEDQQDRATARP